MEKVINLKAYRQQKNKVQREREASLTSGRTSSTLIDLKKDLELRDNKLLEVIDSLQSQLTTLYRRQAATLKILKNLTQEED